MMSVPVLDANRLESSETLRELDTACREWGFFQLVGHGISEDTLARLESEMRDFFAQPACVKRRGLRSEENPWGFFDQELTKNTLDCKEIFDCGPANDPMMKSRWPQSKTGFRETMTEFSDACEAIAFRLLDCLSSNLGMPQGELAEGFRPRHTSFLRLNYYPTHQPDADRREEPAKPDTSPTHGESVRFGVNRHTDAGAITLLYQDDQSGLEVLHEGRWVPIEPRRDALVVNVGDIVQVWSNDRYPAALHRVRASATEARFSAPYFFNPAYETTYAPLPSTVSDGQPCLYRPIQWGEFRNLRATGDYRDCGEEVQIDHYRIEKGD